MPEPMQSLARTLQSPVPGEFASLGADDLRLLDGAVAAAAHARSRALTEAIESSLRHLPALLRPAVKKVLGL